MAEVSAVVFVIDDDPSMRAALEDLVSSVGLEVRLSPRRRSFCRASRRTPRAVSCSMCDCQG